MKTFFKIFVLTALLSGCGVSQGGNRLFAPSYEWCTGLNDAEFCHCATRYYARLCNAFLEKDTMSNASLYRGCLAEAVETFYQNNCSTL